MNRCDENGKCTAVELSEYKDCGGFFPVTGRPGQVCIFEVNGGECLNLSVRTEAITGKKETGKDESK